MRLVQVSGYARKGGGVVTSHSARRAEGRAVAERLKELFTPEPNTGCWLWTGVIDSKGYGQLTVRKKLQRAHRLSYEIHKGPIPEGLQIDHKCRLRCCVNPEHLEAVTQQENLRRGGLHRRRAVCANGHPLTPENLRPIGRMCAVCHRDRERERGRRRRALAKAGKPELEP